MFSIYRNKFDSETAVNMLSRVIGIGVHASYFLENNNSVTIFLNCANSWRSPNGKYLVWAGASVRCLLGRCLLLLLLLLLMAKYFMEPKFDSYPSFVGYLILLPLNEACELIVKCVNSQWNVVCFHGRSRFLLFLFNVLLSYAPAPISSEWLTWFCFVRVHSFVYLFIRQMNMYSMLYSWHVVCIFMYRSTFMLPSRESAVQHLPIHRNHSIGSDFVQYANCLGLMSPFNESMSDTHLADRRCDGMPTVNMTALWFINNSLRASGSMKQMRIYLKSLEKYSNIWREHIFAH